MDDNISKLREATNLINDAKLTGDREKLKQALDIVNKVKESEGCAYCREDLEIIGKGISSAMENPRVDDLNLISKSLDATIIKQSRLTDMIKEMESKGLLNVEDELRAKFSTPSNDIASTYTQTSTIVTDLGINDLAADVSDLLQDIKEVNNAVSLVDDVRESIMRELPKPPLSMLIPPDPLGLLSNNKNRLPLPHELLFKKS
jgi:hypothetical protein